jgi:hypothetical protein
LIPISVILPNTEGKHNARLVNFDRVPIPEDNPIIPLSVIDP